MSFFVSFIFVMTTALQHTIQYRYEWMWHWCVGPTVLANVIESHIRFVYFYVFLYRNLFFIILFLSVFSFSCSLENWHPSCLNMSISINRCVISRVMCCLYNIYGTDTNYEFESFPHYRNKWKYSKWINSWTCVLVCLNGDRNYPAGNRSNGFESCLLEANFMFGLLSTVRRTKEDRYC